jgi:phosphopantetheinyl transferase
MKLRRLESAASERLQCPIHLISARHPIELETLDPLDRNRLGEFTTVRRRQQWLRGRQALLEIARVLQIDASSSALRPPRTGISLTHSDPLSIAAGVEADAGIGVDLESWRRTSPAMLRWYLTETERRQLDVASQQTRLRLWTVKEALFKANNDDRERALTDFEIDDVTAITGCARSPRQYFRYTSFNLPQGILSITIRNQGDNSNGNR